jgi:hypothetical protein
VDADGSSVLGRAGSRCRRVLKILTGRSMPLSMQTSPAPEGYRPARCPECAALVRGDVPWCTACYVRLDGSPAGVASGLPAGPVRDAATAPPAQPASAPDALPEQLSSADPEDVDAVAARLLAELAATREQPGWTGWLPGTRAGRTVAVAALLAGCSAVLLAAMTLVGLVL